MSVSVEDLVERARRRITRVGPQELAGLVAEGALVVDIRPEAQRRLDGSFPYGVVVERNVLEWRLDPLSDHRLPEMDDHRQRVIVVCTEGYASSLAAASLADLGLERVADLAGGFRAWRDWIASHAWSSDENDVSSACQPTSPFT